MKKSIILIGLILASMGLYSQNRTGTVQRADISRYETFIYTSDRVDVLIRNEYKKLEGERGYLSGLLNASLNAGKEMAGGYVASFIDMGVNVVASLITQSANNKIKWEETVKAENAYQEILTTVEPINNFYSTPSFDGPMDPAGMNFNGIGCLRTIEGDTVFYLSCHIDPSKINRIVNHSKFELLLDTLIIDPYHCNLPNSNFDTEFSFDRRQDLQITVEIRLISSWINELTQLQKNQELGAFAISVPVNQNELDNSGKLRYVRTSNSPVKYGVSGESFIVPRSYMGFRDEENNYKNSWGTGDYKIELSLKETCNITGSYRKDWKSDWKRRQDAENDENFMQRSWKMISSQRWDAISKQWVITTLKAPADMITDDLLNELELPSPAAAKNAGDGASTGGKKK
jgi:hypothetical protein